MTKELRKTIGYTARIPRKIYLALRRMEEAEEIKSIQAAIIKGLEWVISKRKGGDGK